MNHSVCTYCHALRAATRQTWIKIAEKEKGWRVTSVTILSRC